MLVRARDSRVHDVCKGAGLQSRDEPDAEGSRIRKRSSAGAAVDL